MIRDDRQKNICRSFLTEGAGLHDASWRSSFGGSIYKTNGSHGCVNMPYSVAKAIYENIEDYTTIICRY